MGIWSFAMGECGVCGAERHATPFSNGKWAEHSKYTDIPREEEEEKVETEESQPMAVEQYVIPV